MHDSKNTTGTRSDTRRAEAFGDGVFAIIITLLILDLRPPQAEPGRLLHGLLQQWPTYLAYVTSYVYVAVIWLNHKAAFNRIREMDPALHWANLGILFATALLPFPTAVVSVMIRQGNPVDSRVAVGMYALVGVLLCLSWVVFFRYLQMHPELTLEPFDRRFFRGEKWRAWAGVPLYAGAGLLGYFVAPWTAMIIFLALPIFYGVTSHGLDRLKAH